MSEREQFEAWFEEHTGWDAEDYPNKYLLDVCWEAWQASREARKAEQEGDGWIACADRMPEDRDAVIVCDHWIDIYPAVFIGGVFYEYGEGLIEDACRISNPTHWQPLPSPPVTNHPIDTTPNQYDALGKGERG